MSSNRVIWALALISVHCLLLTSVLGCQDQSSESQGKSTTFLSRRSIRIEVSKSADLVNEYSTKRSILSAGLGEGGQQNDLADLNSSQGLPDLALQSQRNTFITQDHQDGQQEQPNTQYQAGAQQGQMDAARQTLQQQEQDITVPQQLDMTNNAASLQQQQQQLLQQQQQQQLLQQQQQQQAQNGALQQPLVTTEQPQQPDVMAAQHLDSDRLLTFENDPVPNPVQLMDWQRTDPPEELTSSSFLSNGSEPGYAAMCLVVRDQHDDILEWIHHHLRLGISTIYVWDNGSEPPLWHLLQKFIIQGVVVYNHFTTFEHPTDRPQLYAYDRCLQDHGHKHTWMVFIDADEFLIFKDGPPVQSLPHFLKEFEGYSGLGVHWILFGSSGHQARPPHGVLRSYHKCLPLQHTQHTLVKTIANTRCTQAAWGPHAFHHNCSQPVVRTNHEPIEGPRADRPVFGRLVLHHYATKSLQDFQAKMARGSGMRRQRGMEYFQFVDAWSVEYNFDAYRVWDDQAEFQHYPSIQTLQGRYNKLPVHDWNS